MSVRLRVLHGSIKRRGKWQLTVPIKRSPFVIGQASDCQMRCYGRSICDEHCKITVDGDQVFVSDLNTLAGTFVNGKRLDTTTRMFAGDRLQVGRLAFELLVSQPASTRQRDGFGDFVSEMLLEADEAERQERAQSPESRWYDVEPVAPKDPYEGMTAKERLIAKARQKLPQKQAKPMKLPNRQIIAANTNEAVIESLATYYKGLELQPLDFEVFES